MHLQLVHHAALDRHAGYDLGADVRQCDGARLFDAVAVGDGYRVQALAAGVAAVLERQARRRCGGQFQLACIRADVDVIAGIVRFAWRPAQLRQVVADLFHLEGGYRQQVEVEVG